MAAIQYLQEYPQRVGFISTVSSSGIGIIGVLSSEEIVRLIASIGGLMGIILTCLSIFYLIKKNSR